MLPAIQSDPGVAAFRWWVLPGTTLFRPDPQQNPEGVTSITRRTGYAVTGALMALGAPAGLLIVRLRGKRLSVRALADELQTDAAIYLYSGLATAAAFALFGGALGERADRLAQLAATDALTGLANVRAFSERLHQELIRASRYDETVSVLLIDLDGLKLVNDRHGHRAGDAALQTVAAAIRDGLREIDLGARIGGDEFAVVAPRTDAPSAMVLAERLRAHVARANAAPERRRTTISIGVASFSPQERSTPAALLASADRALYEAKRTGGNRVVAAHLNALEAGLSGFLRRQ